MAVSQLTNLFKPITIGTVEVPNRIVQGTFGAACGYGQDDMVTDRMVAFFAERAKGGCGLLMLGSSPYEQVISPEVIEEMIERMGGDASEMGEMGVMMAGRGAGIYDSRFIPGLRKLTDTIHSCGGKIGTQPFVPMMLPGHGGRPEVVGPSDVSPNPRGGPGPRPMTKEEIGGLADQMAEGARRAREAGFDLVEIFALAGNLVSQFMSPYTNKRTDEYGGSHENRLRFLLEIVERVHSEAGKDFPVLCRISGQDFMPGGNMLEDTVIFASMLEEVGVAAINVSTGWHESSTPFIHSSVPRGHWIFMPEAVKEAVRIPVIGGTRVNDPILADQLLAQGRVDMVYMGRPLMADPHLPNKAREGRFDEIRTCIACNHCFGSMRFGVSRFQGVTCAINYRAGRELDYPIAPTTMPKKVVIIGGGPAGMEAARVAALRGHNVILMEKSNELGGQLLLAAIPPGKGEITELIRYLSVQLGKCNVKVKLGQEVTAEVVEEANPDVVIVATGGTSIIPDIPGVNGDNVVTAVDVLLGEEVGDRVVIIGGGLIGCETAEFLAQKGKKVTILEMLERIAHDMLRPQRWVTVQNLRNAGVRLETLTRAEEITAQGARAARNGGSDFFEADTVVIAAGVASEKQLVEELEKKKMGPVHVIGDCARPRRIADAIEEGFLTAWSI